jgi:hypothetical protein
MLRDPENPDISWEDYQSNLEKHPDRPFYPPGITLSERRYNAEQRCQKIGRFAVEHPDLTGSTYFTCEEDN